MAARTKEAGSPAPERLGFDARVRIGKWCACHYPAFHSQLGHHWEKCRAHHEKFGNRFVSWEAAFRSWLVIEAERRGIVRLPGTEMSRERPQERRGGSGSQKPLESALMAVLETMEPAKAD